MAWVQGIDVSHWQGLTRPDWARFAWMKASQGRSMRDQKMDSHHGNLEGIARGPYHFYDFGSTAAQNADNFLAATRGRTWELPHVLDAEHGGAGNKATTAAVLLDFLGRIEQGTGRTPVVYTYASWWNATVEARQQFANYPLWIARYPNAYANGSVPATTATTGAAKPWKSWSVWQFSSAGNLDRNVTTEANLAALIGGHARTTTPDRPTQEGTLMALTDPEQHELLTIARRLDATAERKPVAVRDPRDRKVWIIDGGTRTPAPDAVMLDVLVYTGQVQGWGSEGIAIADPVWLDQIPAA